MLGNNPGGRHQNAPVSEAGSVPSAEAAASSRAEGSRPKAPGRLGPVIGNISAVCYDFPPRQLAVLVFVEMTIPGPLPGRYGTDAARGSSLDGSSAQLFGRGMKAALPQIDHQQPPITGGKMEGNWKKRNSAENSPEVGPKNLWK